jgi:hypothetical protein
VEPTLDWFWGNDEVTARLPDGHRVRYTYESGKIGNGSRYIPTGRWLSHGRVTVFGTFGSYMEVVRERWFHRLLVAIGYAVEHRCGDGAFDRRCYLLTEDPQSAREIGVDAAQRSAILAAFDAGADRITIDDEGLTADFRSLPNLNKVDPRDGTPRLDRLASLVGGIADRRRTLAMRDATPADLRRRRWMRVAGWWQFGSFAVIWMVAKFGPDVRVASDRWLPPLLCGLFVLVFSGPVLWCARRRSNAMTGLAMLPIVAGLSWLLSDRLTATVISAGGTAAERIEPWPIIRLDGTDAVAGPYAARFDASGFEAEQIPLGDGCLFVVARRGRLGAVVDDVLAAGPCGYDPHKMADRIAEVRRGGDVGSDPWSVPYVVYYR